jgi:hypothetical protein
VATLTLALGIGISTIVFRFYEAVALKPIAASAPAELIRISGGILGGILGNQDTARHDSFSDAQFRRIPYDGTIGHRRHFGAEAAEDKVGSPASRLSPRFSAGRYWRAILNWLSETRLALLLHQDAVEHYAAGRARADFRVRDELDRVGDILSQRNGPLAGVYWE